MTANALIACRVTSEVKVRVRRLAELQGVNESTLVKQLLHAALRSSTPTDESSPQVPGPGARQQRINVRLAAEDRRLLAERAAVRCVAPATYVALLVRSHLLGCAPLPRAEYLALRQSVLELTAIGRNLNKIARTINQAGSTALPGQAEVAAMLRVAEALRDHFKELLKANVVSWSCRANTSA